jgi:hypothetical protein
MRGIPKSLHDLLRCDFLCGVDPVFADLHQHEETFDGRSYRGTAHVAYEHNQMHRPRAARVDTVVLPTPEHPIDVIHELGHILHGRLKFRWLAAEPVSAYAKSDPYEAFAEAFTAWCQPHYATRPDAATFDYFDRVAVGDLR